MAKEFDCILSFVYYETSTRVSKYYPNGFWTYCKRSHESPTSSCCDPNFIMEQMVYKKNWAIQCEHFWLDILHVQQIINS